MPLVYDKDDIRKFLYIEEGKTLIIPLYYISDLQSKYLLFILTYYINRKVDEIIQKYGA